MRNRTKLVAILSTLAAVFAAMIVALVSCAGPGAVAEGPAPPPATPAPDIGTDADTGTDAGTDADIDAAADDRSGSRGGGGGGDNARRRPPSKPVPSRTTPRTPTPTLSEELTWDPPQIGNASVPGGADFTGDQETFTIRFESLEAGAESARTRTVTATVQTPGYTHKSSLELSVSGYAFALEPADAMLGVTANGVGIRHTFHGDADEEFTRTVAVPLRGAQKCTITIKAEVHSDGGAEAYLNVTSLDGRLV
jgi:hypothetical protein